MLYTCNKIINDTTILNSIQSTDNLILLEDGVYNLSHTDFIRHVNNLNNITVYVIDIDYAARNITRTTIPMTIITYDTFVAYCIKHSKICQL
ncbi:MAG: hypothetical protein CMF49_09185 [Legionellales bacterium]|nr:hypothetical protein [Legionellales bacterium]